MHVLLDGDPGHDDMLTVFLAAKHVDVVGINGRCLRHRHGLASGLAARPARLRPPLGDEAGHRGATHRHAQMRQEPRPGSAAANDADPPLRFGQPTRPAGPRRNEIGCRLGKGAPAAARVRAVEASDLNAQRRS